MKFINPKQAFTLSEVLITPGIIGIVAAMTMQTLMASYKKAGYCNTAKKSKMCF